MSVILVKLRGILCVDFQVCGLHRVMLDIAPYLHIFKLRVFQIHILLPRVRNDELVHSEEAHIINISKLGNLNDPT